MSEKEERESHKQLAMLDALVSELRDEKPRIEVSATGLNALCGFAQIGIIETGINCGLPAGVVSVFASKRRMHLAEMTALLRTGPHPESTLSRVFMYADGRMQESAELILKHRNK